MDLFWIWLYKSPLRSWLWETFNEGVKYLLDIHEDLLAVLLCRCIFRLTEKKVDVYDTVVERLGNSTISQDLLMKQVMEYEGNRKDYIMSRLKEDTRIKHYSLTADDEEGLLELRMPHHGRNIDIPEFIGIVDLILWGDDFDVKDIPLNVNVRLLLDLLIDAMQL
jgi:hypothetical protein